MKFLLATNLVAEWVKPRPEPRVVSWLAQVDEDLTCLSVATLAEIRHGVDAIAAGRRRDRLATWLAEDSPARFEGRIVPIDRGIALA